MIYGPNISPIRRRIPDVAEMLNEGKYLHERHAYLERKVQQGWILCRCLCGDCLDEKRELKGYRLQKANKGKAETAKERVEKLVQEYGNLTDEEKKGFLS